MVRAVASLLVLAVSAAALTMPERDVELHAPSPAVAQNAAPAWTPEVHAPAALPHMHAPAALPQNRKTKALNLKAKDATEMPEMFAASIDRSRGESLGVGIESDKDRLVITRVLGEGLIPRWNSANPGRELKAGDYIVEVGSKSGDASVLMEQLKQEAVFNVKVMRGDEVAAHVKQLRMEQGEHQFVALLDRSNGGKLGMGVKPSDWSGKLLISSILDDGVVPKWNKEHPDQALKVGDYITKVSGVKGDPSLLVAQLQIPELHKVTVLPEAGAKKRRVEEANKQAHWEAVKEKKMQRQEKQAAKLEDLAMQEEAYTGRPQFSVELDRKEGDALGLGMQLDGNSLLISTVDDQKGVVAKWNAAHPDQQLKMGDYIVKVGIITGDGPKMFKELTQWGGAHESILNKVSSMLKESPTMQLEVLPGEKVDFEAGKKERQAERERKVQQQVLKAAEKRKATSAEEKQKEREADDASRATEKRAKSVQQRKEADAARAEEEQGEKYLKSKRKALLDEAEEKKQGAAATFERALKAKKIKSHVPPELIEGQAPPPEDESEEEAKERLPQPVVALDQTKLEEQSDKTSANQEIVALFDRTTRASLGVVVVQAKNRLLITRIEGSGLVAGWNAWAKYAKKDLRVGDYIVEVDNQRGSAQELFERLQTQDGRKITMKVLPGERKAENVMTPEEIEIAILKDSIEQEKRGKEEEILKAKAAKNENDHLKMQAENAKLWDLLAKAKKGRDTAAQEAKKQIALTLEDKAKSRDRVRTLETEERVPLEERGRVQDRYGRWHKWDEPLDPRLVAKKWHGQ